MAIALFLFAADEGWSLSFNELCSAQWEEFLDAAGDARGVPIESTIVVSREVVPGCPLDSFGRRWFGNAIVHLTPGQDGVAAFLPTQQLESGEQCGDDSVECRTMFCAKVGSFVGDLGECTTHLENDDSIAETQSAEYLFLSAVWLGSGRWRWWFGDFNLTPGEVPDAWETNAFDLVPGGTFTSSRPTDQLDYIWLARTPDVIGSFSIFPNGGFFPHCEPDASDHCWVKGEAIWDLI